MTNSAIVISNISKKYTLGKAKESSLRDTIASIFKKRNSQNDEFYALKNVSFSINKGDVVGIVGKNGAGKSTLLKILSQITKPSEGTIHIDGRIASLLEVGTGFHPELTGRENIYLNGTILGMTRKEVKEKFDEIVAFSGIEKFIDTAVKHYSSGMYVRLAFSVAAHLEPEILVIDEVLAVGDIEFQKKCLGKMQDVASKGRTVLFVSHNMSAVKSLCNTAVYLDQGKLVKQGNVQEIIDKYLSENSGEGNRIEWNEANAPKNEYIQLNKVEIINNELNYINEELSIEIDFNYTGENTSLNLSIVLTDFNETPIFNVFTESKESNQGNYKAIIKIPANLLNSIKYSLDIYFVANSKTVLFDYKKAFIFQMNEPKRDVNWYGKWTGLIRPQIPFDFKKMNN